MGNKCPECDVGEIKETQKEIKKTQEGEPLTIRTRVGCSNCGYTLNEENFDV